MDSSTRTDSRIQRKKPDKYKTARESLVKTNFSNKRKKKEYAHVKFFSPYSVNPRTKPVSKEIYNLAKEKLSVSGQKSTGFSLPPPPKPDDFGGENYIPRMTKSEKKKEKDSGHVVKHITRYNALMRGIYGNTFKPIEVCGRRPDVSKDNFGNPSAPIPQSVKEIPEYKGQPVVSSFPKRYAAALCFSLLMRFRKHISDLEDFEVKKDDLDLPNHINARLDELAALNKKNKNFARAILKFARVMAGKMEASRLNEVGGYLSSLIKILGECLSILDPMSPLLDDSSIPEPIAFSLQTVPNGNIDLWFLLPPEDALDAEARRDLEQIKALEDAAKSKKANSERAESRMSQSTRAPTPNVMKDEWRELEVEVSSITSEQLNEEERLLEREEQYEMVKYDEQHVIEQQKMMQYDKFVIFPMIEQRKMAAEDRDVFEDELPAHYKVLLKASASVRRILILENLFHESASYLGVTRNLEKQNKLVSELIDLVTAIDELLPTLHRIKIALTGLGVERRKIKDLDATTVLSQYPKVITDIAVSIGKPISKPHRKVIQSFIALCDDAAQDASSIIESLNFIVTADNKL
ncbi:hypothetical protein PCE1_000987 [Barthelona sp. PCE]